MHLIYRINGKIVFFYNCIPLIMQTTKLIKAISDALRDEMWDKRPIKNEFLKEHFCIEFDFNVIQF